nr:MAG TPA: hypothetical protein [Podoviridae sp. ctgHy19]
MRDDALRFCEVQLRRCKINLDAAEARGDTRAVSNLQRKISIYTYLINILNGDDINGCG